MTTVALLVVGAGCQVQPPEPDAPKASGPASVAKTKAPAVEPARYLSGGEGDFTLGAFSGRPVLLSIHTPGAGSTTALMGELNALQESSGGQGGVIVGVLTAFAPDEDPASVAGRYPVIFPLVQASQAWLEQVAPLRALPSTILIDAKGVVRKVHAGSVDRALVQREWAELLAGR